MEENRLRVFEIRVLGRIFGAKMDGATGGWRKLNDEELLLAKFHYNYQVEEDEVGGVCSTNEGGEETVIIKQVRSTRKTKT
jgi:hypothetical protein